MVTVHLVYPNTKNTGASPWYCVLVLLGIVKTIIPSTMQCANQRGKRNNKAPPVFYIRFMATSLSADVAAIRRSYEKAALNESASHTNPLQQFTQWFEEALQAQVLEPNAMTLATVGSDLRPSTRIVLLKGFDENGIVWYTNYHSRKGKELAGNPFAALQFFWAELERVVRIEGTVEKISAEQSDTYFHSRPLDSRIGAWASPQSQVIDSRTTLLANATRYGAKYLLQPPRPPHWGGYCLQPQRWEFWQGRKSRLHDRLSYRLQDTHWIRERLAP